MCVTYSKNWNLLLYMWNIFVTCLWHVVMCWKNNSYHMGNQFSKSKIKDDRMTSNDTLLHLFCWHWTLEKTRKNSDHPCQKLWQNDCSLKKYDILFPSPYINVMLGKCWVTKFTKTNIELRGRGIIYFVAFFTVLPNIYGKDCSIYKILQFWISWQRVSRQYSQ